MKTWMLALSFIALLGMAGLADAGGKGKKGKGGMQGKISSVASGTLTLSTGHAGKKKKAAATTQPTSMMIKFDNTTTIMIDGVVGKLDASAIGKYATVLGSINADASVTATQISVTTNKPSKKKKST